AAPRLAPLQPHRWTVATVLDSIPLRLARRARPDGAPRRDDAVRALERLGARALHEREPEARVGLAEAVRRVDAEKLYYALELVLSTPTWIVMSLYLVSDLNLSPLQLVLMGTAMEASVFLCEVPTGVVADTYSRRLSLVIGFLGMGTAWLLVGVVSSPVVVIALWALWGVSYTFTSGASEAWITDGVGVERVPIVFLRGARFTYVGSFVGLFVFVALGVLSFRAAVVCRGAGRG